jgi:4a-hydroxytetrahydrobiopterin dehydratase
MAALSDSERGDFLLDHPEWVLDGESIARTFVFGDFIESIGFVARVAMASEVADHHPDIDVRWNKVSLTLSTHDEGALTEKDTKLAAVFDSYAKR